MPFKECVNCGWKGEGGKLCPRCQGELQCDSAAHEFVGKTSRGDIYKECRVCGYIQWIRTRNDIDDDRSFRGEIDR